MMLADNTVIDEAEGSFDVKTPYIPPVASASVKVMPAVAATLETPDNKIRITFPAESVTEAVTISLTDFPPEQLPPLPDGYKATELSFRISGLTGLLAQKAAIEIKYADTKSGDNDLLKLARWDESKKKWTILKTSIDRTDMTLSSKTDRFSIWAIVLVPRPKIDPVLIMAGAVACFILIFTLTSRTKKKRMHEH
jgi:hypothetical protein